MQTLSSALRKCLLKSVMSEVLFYWSCSESAHVSKCRGAALRTGETSWEPPAPPPSDLPDGWTAHQDCARLQKITRLSDFNWMHLVCQRCKLWTIQMQTCFLSGDGCRFWLTTGFFRAWTNEFAPKLFWNQVVCCFGKSHTCSYTSTWCWRILNNRMKHRTSHYIYVYFHPSSNLTCSCSFLGLVSEFDFDPLCNLRCSFSPLCHLRCSWLSLSSSQMVIFILFHISDVHFHPLPHRRYCFYTSCYVAWQHVRPYISLNMSSASFIFILISSQMFFLISHLISFNCCRIIEK